jgi:hypothetical protein
VLVNSLREGSSLPHRHRWQRRKFLTQIRLSVIMVAVIMLSDRLPSYMIVLHFPIAAPKHFFSSFYADSFLAARTVYVVPSISDGVLVWWCGRNRKTSRSVDRSVYTQKTKFDSESW